MPQRSQALPQPEAPLPPPGQAFPQRPGQAFPQRPSPLPQTGGPLPQRAESLPQRGESLPQRGDGLPQRGDGLPQRGDGLPQRSDALPRRPSRTPRAGRHRSPHRLTVASDAPALVLAVPGQASADSEELTGEIVIATAASCPGVDIRVGYLAGDHQRLDEIIVPGPAEARQLGPSAVVVPLLTGPHPLFDPALAAVAGRAGDQVMLASHLGPHPLLAEALHSRLAEAGQARQGRVRGLSIVTRANGVLVLADRGEEAVQAAGVTAVLLAARLAVSVVPASVDDPVGIDAALTMLRQAGASSLAIAPHVIGPETRSGEIEAVAARLGAACAPALAAHPAIAQLVAIRYGAALAGLSVASSPG